MFVTDEMPAVPRMAVSETSRRGKSVWTRPLLVAPSMVNAASPGKRQGQVRVAGREGVAAGRQGATEGEGRVRCLGAHLRVPGRVDVQRAVAGPDPQLARGQVDRHRSIARVQVQVVTTAGGDGPVGRARKDGCHWCWRPRCGRWMSAAAGWTRAAPMISTSAPLSPRETGWSVRRAVMVTRSVVEVTVTATLARSWSASFWSLPEPPARHPHVDGAVAAGGDRDTSVEGVHDDERRRCRGHRLALLALGVDRPGDGAAGEHAARAAAPMPRPAPTAG